MLRPCETSKLGLASKNQREGEEVLTHDSHTATYAGGRLFPGGAEEC